MARVTPNGLNGKLGGLVYYSVDGELFVRTNPGKLNLPANKRRTPEKLQFGKVSKYGSAMLRMARHCFLFHFSTYPYNAMRGYMKKLYQQHLYEPSWPLSVKGCGQCQLNKKSDLRNLLKAGFEVNDLGNGSITVSFEAITPFRTLEIPGGCSRVRIKVVAVTSSFGIGQNRHNTCMDSFEIPNHASTFPAKNMVLSTNGIKGDTVFVLIALEYELARQMFCSDAAWMPIAIVAVGRLQ